MRDATGAAHVVPVCIRRLRAGPAPHRIADATASL